MLPPGQQDVHEFFWKRIFSIIQDETNPKNVDQKKKDDWDNEKSWIWYNRYHRSLLDMLFGGQYEGTVKCKSCGKVSHTYDPFLEISLKANISTMLKGMDEELESEDLPKKVGYRCEKCKKVTSIIKSIKIDKTPKYLIIHLKRLVNAKTKISKFIEFPSKFDLSPYCAKKQKRVYILQAVCVHNGSGSGGHFYAAGKRGDKVY